MIDGEREGRVRESSRVRFDAWMIRVVMMLDDASQPTTIRVRVPGHDFLRPKLVATGVDEGLVEDGLQIIARVERRWCDARLETVQRRMVGVERDGMIVVNYPIVHEGWNAEEGQNEG